MDDPDSPATHVSWNDAHAFITRVNELTGQTFRLPTEAESEYACRAGTTTEYYFGDSSANLGDYAWWHGNAWDIGEKYAHVVGQKTANAFGLFDMHGNVWEWCLDCYHPQAYSFLAETDPHLNVGDPQAKAVKRGGSWTNSIVSIRCSKRGFEKLHVRRSNLGFRCAH